MIVCHKCGTELSEGQRICTSCGSDNSETARRQQPAHEESASTTVSARATQFAKKASSRRTTVNSTTKAIIAGGVAILFASGLIFWQVKASRAGVNISADDMTKIVETLPAQAQAQFAESDEARKGLAKDLKELLALAEEAKSAGFAERPDMQRQLALARSVIIGQNYLEEQRKKPVKGTGAGVSQAEIEQFLTEPGQDQKFEEFLSDAKARNPQAANLPDAQKQQLKQQWAQIMVAERKGKQAGLDKNRRVELQIMLQEARTLANQYAKEQLVDRIKATEPEIDAYIAKHPELDPTKAREQAEVILKRARAGEDFAKLAEEFSSDPGSKIKGGDLGWFGRAEMVKPFADAAFALQPGQISDVVESDFGYHIIKLEERGMKPGQDGQPEEQVHARHILIGKGSQQANPFAPPQSPRDQAKAAVEQEKQKKLIEEIVQRSHVRVAENFTVKKPERPAAPEGLPPGMEEEEEPPVEAPPPPPPTQEQPSNKGDATSKPKPVAPAGKRKRGN